LLAAYRRPSPGLLDWLRGDYGPDQQFILGRCEAIARALERYLELFGDDPVALSRTPARISLNPHCDHQGAWVPYGCHGREIILVCSPIEEDRVCIGNTDLSFSPLLEFCPATEVRRAPEAWARGWTAYLDSPAIRTTVAEAVDGDEQTADRTAALNYVRAAWLRHRRHQVERVEEARSPTPGMRLVLAGDIPQAGGLSSSSAVVVSVFQMLAMMSEGGIARRRMAELCGEAEWYVGTRGGSGDHAAMLLGERGALTHIRFRAPLGVRECRRSPFPQDYALLLAHSGVRSEKSAAQRILFNRGIFAYKFAYMALRTALEAVASEEGIAAEVVRETESLGDLNQERLDTPTLYRLLARLPEVVSSRSLARTHPEQFAAAAQGCFGTRDLDRLPEEIPLRGAALFGLGRVDRGLKMADLLDDGGPAAMERFGRWMSVTHDGDRVMDTRNGAPQTYTAAADDQRDESLEQWAQAAADRNPRAELAERAGCYGASVPQLDRLVDVLQAAPGVLGAGLMGAGGGGYALALVERRQIGAVREAVQRDFYQPLDLEPQVEEWRATAAAGALPAAALAPSPSGMPREFSPAD